MRMMDRYLLLCTGVEIWATSPVSVATAVKVRPKSWWTSTRGRTQTSPPLSFYQVLFLDLLRVFFSIKELEKKSSNYFQIWSVDIFMHAKQQLPIDCLCRRGGETLCPHPRGWHRTWGRRGAEIGTRKPQERVSIWGLHRSSEWDTHQDKGRCWQWDFYLPLSHISVPTCVPIAIAVICQSPRKY